MENKSQNIPKPVAVPAPAARIAKTPKITKGGHAARKAWQTRRSR